MFFLSSFVVISIINLATPRHLSYLWRQRAWVRSRHCSGVEGWWMLQTILLNIGRCRLHVSLVIALNQTDGSSKKASLRWHDFTPPTMLCHWKKGEYSILSLHSQFKHSVGGFSVEKISTICSSTKGINLISPRHSGNWRHVTHECAHAHWGVTKRVRSGVKRVRFSRVSNANVISFTNGSSCSFAFHLR